ncbi:MAG: cation transporter [Thiotrichaceae bacterium]|nr:cation transporter [Thiotrichaceae bacterium]
MSATEHHHKHQADHHSGHHHHHPGSGNALLWALALTLSFAVVEAVGGVISGSLALLGDAGHMLTDAMALGLAAFAAWLTKQPRSARHSYGLVRAEVVAALINGLFMLVIVFTITYHAIDRLLQPQPVAGGMVMVIAAIGLMINIVVAMILHRGEQTLNTRAAYLHVLGDLLGSVAALVAGAVIYFTGWIPIDPLLSLLICTLILYSCVRLLREGLHVIMEGVPLNLDYDQIGSAMTEPAAVDSIHDLHVWTLSSGLVALSAHVVIRDMNEWEAVLGELSVQLDRRFDIQHITLQPELMQRACSQGC